MTQDMNHTFGKALRAVFVATMMSLTGSHALADGVVVNGNVFGGGNLAEVKGSVIVNIKAGTVEKDVYGGGALADTNTGNSTDTSVKTTKVFLLGGTINQNVFGGGLGEKKLVNGATADNPAYVNGDVKISLNGLEIEDHTAGMHGTLAVMEVDSDEDTNPDYYKVSTGGCVVKGSIFGCNNLCGTPKGKVKVHVFKTVGDGESHKRSTDKGNTTYELTAVYGGGNMSAYEPTDATSNNETTMANAHTEVIIEGCEETSIGQVYGGGNAASTPATNVTIKGSYEIGEVFGGGNGAGTVPITYQGNDSQENPGANVGFKEYGAVWVDYPEDKPFSTKDERIDNYGYGSGKAQVNIHGGTIHAIYGGSNTKGNVREVAVAMLEEEKKDESNPICALLVDEAYGGGKSAPMDGRAELRLGCIPGVGTVYGGARAAAVNNNVTLTITNGTFNKVFGGNNEAGTINGTITLNIEETGCTPIVIGQLYGGGNRADYTAPTGENGPTLNIKSFTSIGEVYGGGYSADVTGNVQVNINEVVGAQAAIVDGYPKDAQNQTITSLDGVAIPPHAKNEIGAIRSVYGGGYGADVIGDVEVNIGTVETIDYVSMASGESTPRTGISVEGANITGSVYGGGYGANTTVTGNVKLNIGGESTSLDGTKLKIEGSVYGGSALGAVNASTTKDATTGNITAYSPTEDATTTVTLKKGKVTRYVFGGGQGNSSTTAHVYGPSTVTLYGDVVAGGLYGGCDANGEMHNGTQLNLFGGTVGQSSAPTADILFGGGLGQATKVDGDVTVNVGSSTYTGNTSVTIWGNVYGGGALGDVNLPKNTSDTNTYTTLVNLYKGTVKGNVFGGGLGQAAVGAQSAVLYTNVDEYNTDKGTSLTAGEFAALSDEQKIKTPAVEAKDAIAAGVKGNVTVKLNENDGTCEVTGSIFGCNNTKGSPEGHVTVHVYKTVKTGNTKDLTKTTLDDRWSETATYDLAAVYGGGNKADYVPTSETDFAEVIIDGCNETSIKEVYGGGYGAAVPATQVKILGTYLINEVFGGGYGAGANNDGANVGYYTYKNEADKTAYTVGNGKSQVKLYGGMVHTAYGGSNTKGNIRVGSSAGKATDIAVSCSLAVKNIYGAGKNADQDGGTDLVIGCIPELKNVYGGARDANIRGGVNLVITGGDFENVFGGNDTSGTIQGPIKVFIEEECDAIKIQNLYLGGNLAAYSVYGYYDDNGTLKPRTSATDTNPVADGTTAPDATTHQYPDPQLYVTKFTKIDNVYGGGYGESAVMYGNPKVNINEVKNLAGNIGEIGNVYGGGDAANVEGNTTVNIGTEKYAMLYNITDGETDVTGYYTRSGSGTTESPYEYTLVEPEAPATNVTAQPNTIYYLPVLGAKMTGNVFGGGNKADVSGNTFVNICAVLDPVLGTDSKPTGDYTYTSVDHSETTDFEGISIEESVYGGGSEADVKGNTRVTMTDGYVFDGVYGGGLQGSVGDFTRADLPSGKPETWSSGGKCTVVISGGQIGPVEVAKADGGMKNTGRYFKEDGDPDGPVDVGFVFGAGRGEVENPNDDPDADFHTYVKETEVTISGTALIMASVYGGGENGRVRGNTKVKIEGGQIGCGVGQIENGKPKRYADGQFINPANPETPVTETNALVGCATWDYGAGLPYDPLADTRYSDGTAVTDASTTGSDGHTYYGSVFGGGSGYYPYEIKDANNNVTGHEWLESAGLVEGDTEVEITGGHILTSVYGGNELTNVVGTCTVTMSGGTIGVPRTKTQVENNPSIGNLFGAGKGDKRVHFNTWTNVKETIVNVTGGIVYGSVFGGGEDGHVLEDATTLIEEDKTNNKTITIGSTGESGADGNVFGGGRGSETALTAGVIGGNVSLTIESGNILGSVYGGGRLAAVGTFFVNPESDSYGVLQSPEAKHGNITININGGTIGTDASTGISGNIFGGSKGTTDFSLGIVRSTTINMTGGTAYASVYGGGELAQVVGSHTTNGKTLGTEINISGGTIGPEKDNLPEGTKYGATYGNVFAGGKGNTSNVEAGLVKTNTQVTISEANSSKPTTIYHNIYGGGAYGSVGTFTYANASAPSMPVSCDNGTGIAYITITGGTIGVDGNENGMVFGSSRGDVGAPGEIHDFLAWVYDTHVTIGETSGSTDAPLVKGSIYGSGENGHTFHDTEVIVHNGTIGITENDAFNGANYKYRGNVYGGGCGTDKYYSTGVAPTGHTLTDGEGDTYNHLAGIVQGKTTVLIDGGHVVHNVYGAGAMGSVGKITNYDDLDDDTKGYKHVSEKSDGAYYDFGLSWPYEFTYNNDATNEAGLSKVTIEGNAVIGVKGTSGHVFGAARGAVDVGTNDITEQRYVEAKLANVRETQVIIGTSGGSSTNTKPTIHGSVYGGGEDGHVYENAAVTIHHGTIAHSVYGGGKGEGTFDTKLYDPSTEAEKVYPANSKGEAVHSWIAGKVFGHTTITMNGGSVGYSIYGGGNLASVGIGNYAGGSDDYSKDGYGELPPENAQALWTNTNFMGSDPSQPTGGLATVNIYGGKVGSEGTTYEGLPTGNIFGSSRGKAALNVGQKSPRYRYVPDFFLGYVNQTAVNIGNGSGEGPTICGSVYGGGQDGHVRRSTKVTINNGTIGYASGGTDRGNVFGAGSGIGTYKEDGEDKCNNSSGSVTCTSTVEVNGGANIFGNVYGGGALASVGPPFAGNMDASNKPYDELKATASGHLSNSYTQVNIKGGKISGDVYGASRGPSDALLSTVFTESNPYDASQFATVIWSDVNVGGAAAITGSVYGGGEKGIVKHATEVNIGIPAVGETAAIPFTGTISESVYGGGKEAIVGANVTVNMNAGTGIVTHDVYGGGALANTNTNINKVSGVNETGAFDTSDETAANGIKTEVNLLGGIINGDAYGGGLGRLESGTSGQTGYISPVEAKVFGPVAVNVNGTAFNINYYEDDDNTTDIDESTIVNSGRVFGCNNLNGSPQDNVTVHVYQTVSRDAQGVVKAKPTKETQTYELAAVYGGGNLANYVPENGKKPSVIIDGCEETSIKEVYGGGNAAAVPETDVLVNGTYEIEYVFGGGNGKDKYKIGSEWKTNNGADVNGNTHTLLIGGRIHEAYGGSNQKGKITGTVYIDSDEGGTCPLVVDKIVAAGKNADLDGDAIVTLGCMPSSKIKQFFGGADNANVNGRVQLTITSGNFGQVFGGNNIGGVIKGSIKLNIEETGCRPIIIDELYGCGNQAMYSVYHDDEGNPLEISQEEFEELYTTDAARAAHRYDDPVVNIVSATRIGRVFGGGLGERAKVYGNPTVNINQIYGKKYNTDGVTYDLANTVLGEIGADYEGVDENNQTITIKGGVYGGGNEAAVIGNPVVNIGTASKVAMVTAPTYLGALGTAYTKNVTTGLYEVAVQGANIVGNVYGGGNLADVGLYDVANDHVDAAGNTYVNIGAVKGTGDTYTSVTFGSDTPGITVAGNVFGGGKGEAAEPLGDSSFAGAFKCAKAIVTGGTNIHIGNGTVNGNVYGGGEVGRVEEDAVVMIGLGDGGTTPASAPEIKGDVFGAGKGQKTHGYSALMRGNPTVTIEGDAKVRGSVYGGGEIASVGKYNVKKGPNNPVGAPDDVLVGMPYSLANSGSGYCTVIVRGNAEIGPEEEMKMKTTSGKPDDTGHVFGAGKGVLPYDGYGVTDDLWKTDPWRVGIDDKKDIFNSSNTSYSTNYEKEYFKYIETLALATETNVIIGGNAFVKGSVYGGSMNGHVQHDTHVTVEGGQIGQGEGADGRYTDADWASESLAECPHWDFDATSGAPYDPLAEADGTYKYDKYGFVPESDREKTSKGGLPEGKDGHTYYGNVFGGGSGVIPYAPGKWHRGAGSVGGDTYVNITKGHILTSVYGGNEHTDVGTYTKDSNGQPTTTPAANDARGKCTINMTGGTVGVPRTDAEKLSHPVVGNLYGAGKGDQRIFFNTWTNVINTEINISGDARIFGSVFGGGEDGHIIENAVTNIGDVTTKTGKDENGDEVTKDVAENGLIIGTTGTSYYDGNVFGGGRGFSGDAQTAGTVGGNVEVNINKGAVYGSVYGGGRLASVGTMFEYPTLDNGNPNPAYGNFVEDGGGKTYGHVTINISGGIIGNDTESTLIATEGHWYDHTKGGNVFGGSMGRLELLHGTRNPIWPKMAQVKETNVNISGGTIKSNVYGGGELGTVRDNAKVTISGGTVRRDVYGGGYGSKDRTYTVFSVYEPKEGVTTPSSPTDYESHTYSFTPMQFAGCVGKSTTVDMSGGYVRKSVYGGGEMASVGVINCRAAELTSGSSTTGKVWFHDAVSDKDYYYTNMVKHEDETKEFALSWPCKFEYVTGFEGATHVNITGGRIGTTQADDYGIDNGDIYGGGKGFAGDYDDFAFCANVGSANVNIDYTNDSQKTLDPATYWTTGGDCIAGAVYGGGENGHVIGDTYVTLTDGLIGHAMYGGGSGKDQYEKSLLKIGADYESTSPADHYTREIYSITAGKVFGNTNVTMNGGYVVRNVYGGGTMGSVGKGNYAGGTDDYATDGYGENAGGKLWDENTDNGKAFMNSGICTVKILGGTVGYTGTKDGLPYGNVFGGCRGDAAPNITESPRYLYYPEFFVGYANETIVEIGAPNSTTGPTIWGSVYGGGQDGHVRRDATVTINSGTIGKEFTGAATDVNNAEWLHAGNVYGAGSGIGKYNYTYHYKDKSDVSEENYSTSAGSVTHFTKVEVKGGTIHRNVYGGGSLASVGAPRIDQEYDEYRKGDTAEGSVLGNQTLNEVIISGGQIGDDSSYDTNDFHVYGGMVYGGSRGDLGLDNSFSTAVYTDVTVSGTADIKGDVYGGGEAGIVKGDVDVKMTGGNVRHDVYGGGALADTQTSNWNATGGTDGNGDWADATKKSALHKTTVSLLGGTISGDAYGGGLGRLEVKSGETVTTTGIEAKVFGDVKVELNNNNNGGDADDSQPGCAVTRIFGCNNLNGTPKGKVQVNVYATQKKGESSISVKAEKGTGAYDVQAVYGGGNLAKYEPVDALLEYNGTNKAKVDAARPEVYIDGCKVTSIKQVYGGGNAAPVPATYVEIKRAYEIDEVFGGGNGYDNYSLQEGNTSVWYQNPGANVGYYTYATHPKGTGQGSGSQADPYQAVEITKFSGGSENKENRLSTTDPDAIALRYGSGIATLVVKGGTIYTSFGGSNSKGNVRTLLSSTYSAMFDDCPMSVGKSYGGGKDAYSDADANMVADCAKGVKEMFGGSENADFTGEINMHITNGSSLERVFGGNNTSGAVNGSITITIEEGGCEPIKIGELYAGGFLAPYSVYGYENGTEEVAYIDTDGTTKTHTQRKLKESGKRLYNDPRINVISATYIGNIFGGGYQAKLVGNPHINVNMTNGFVNVTKTEKDASDQTTYPYEFTEDGKTYIYKDVAGNTYDKNKVTIPDEEKPTEFIATTDLGSIGNIYGGGNMADIVGDTYVEIGTGTWVTSWDADGKAVYTPITPARNAATITGNVFGGGKGKADDFKCEKAMVGVEDQGFGSTNVIIGNGTIGTILEDGTLKAGTGNVYGGGELGRVEANTNVTIGLEPKEGEEVTDAPVISGNVFGAGAGVATHGYSALVRGNSTVTVQGKAKVEKSVYGGGEIATVGRYKVVDGLPTDPVSGGECTIVIKDNAEIVKDVFGAGKGVDPIYDANNKPKKMNASSGWDILDSEDAYLSFLETLALTSKTDVTIDGSASVKGNVYGGSESGFVHDNTSVTIQGNSEIGTADADSKDVDGNVFGGGKGLASFFSAGRVLGNTNLLLKGGTMHGTVYGGGELGYVGKVTVSPDYRTFTWVEGTGVSNVTMNGSTANVKGHVFGAGKGLEDSFWCEKGIVYGSNVNISNGTVNGNVYGGGEVGRVETHAVVKIGPDSGTGAPVVKGNVFGAGAGKETHGYSALVRGNTEVTIQGDAKVEKNVYGGGEIAAVGKYYLVDAQYKQDHPESKLEIGMPYSLVDDGLGICHVTVKGNAEINENVFGAGEGLVPRDYTFADNAHRPKRMMSYNTALFTEDNKAIWEFADANEKYVWEYFDTKPKYLTFIETLALTTQSIVNIDGNAKVKGNVYGGSESGFVHANTSVTVQGNSTIGTTTASDAGGNVFGGGLGLASFAEAGRVSGNTTVNINGGTMKGNVYGGGSLGDVGTITKNTTDYNYTWTDQDGKANGTNMAKNTGVCTVNVTDGEITGHVFGAGKGLDDTFWCEKAMAYSTNVSISNGKVNGNVYGGGQLGRVENDAVVTIGEGTNEPVIKGNVFGAGAGVATHGYSALVRGDATVTVQGKAKVGKSVYGGGETASVGRFKVVNSLPTEPLSGGTCTVKIQGNAEIGSEGEGYVFGACKGVDPDYEHNEGHVINTGESKAFANEAEYLAFLKTLALTSNTHVTIGGNASVNGSVFGGGQRGIALGNVDVNMTGGTVTKDVYGGGALADTNTGNATDYDTSDETISSTSTYTTTVNLLGGTIGGEAFGGGLGEKTGVNDATSDVEAIVYGDVLVELNKGVAEDAKGCIVDKIFGANNINGTPKGHVTVHVYATQNKDLADIGTKSTVDGVYDVSYVFGGGNAADYVPAAADTKQSTEVIIEGCDLTSIQEVYGGGYGAATPATSILVKGTKIIDNVYGGGYGAGTDNPGANVGYKTNGHSEYGSGKAVVQLMAGTINNVYGGSNTKGDIRDGSSVTNVTNDGGPGCCEKLSVEEIYGGGKSADMYGGAEICLSCMPNDWIGAIYAGAEKADVGNDISLTLTSGKFERVYGGNKSGGKIDGYIEVNIEENPECSTPIIIGELYGGGNEASYEYSNLAKDPDYPSPRVNVRAFTSIGTIYGGGYGKTATVTGNPTVNINVVEGGREYAGDIRDLDDGSKVTLYARSKDGKIGVIGNVFGGGNAAKVIGNTTVNVGTTTEEQMVSLQTTDEQGNVIVVKKPVVGADIRGNVYGGGNQAEVTGSTNVVIGKKTEE